MAKNVQVYPDPDGNGWGVRVVGEEETEPRLFGSREDAIREGERLADERNADLLIHGETGETEAKERRSEEPT